MSAPQSDRTVHAPFRVVVAEDEPLIRESVCKKIATAGCGFTVVGAAADGQSAYRLAEDTRADLVVTDIRMPVEDGLALAERLSIHHPDTRTVIISGYGEFDYARRALRFGVSDYLLKPVRDSELRRTLSRVAAELSEREEASGAAETLRRNRSARTSSDAAEQMLRYLRRHFTERIDVSEAARAANVNYANIGRFFRRYYGTTPLKYLLSLRTDRARKLLIEAPDLDIRTISEMVGYEDQGYFTRVFKRQTGLSPRDYRAGRRAAAQDPPRA